MKALRMLAIPVFIAVLSTAVFADNVTVDYDHAANLAQMKTYSWSKVQTANSIWDGRVKEAIDRELAARGWTELPSGGDICLVAVEKTSVQQEYDTFYDGFGGWRWSRMGESTTTVDNYKVGTLVVSMFDGTSKHLIWRGTASSDLSNNPQKDTKKLDNDVHKMFKNFPPKAVS